MPTDNSSGAKDISSSSGVTKTVVKSAVVVVAMFAFVFVVMVPLYNVLCDALGINGKTSGEQYQVVEAAIDTSREIRVQFVASNNDGMMWEFHPTDSVLRVHPGGVNDTLFYAKNPMAKAMIAQAIPSISPARAVEYFHKTECFCFNQQHLAAGEDIDMPLQFIVDQDLPADIKTITLSYTLFDVTDMVEAAPTITAR
ncbi:MAG: cytochrome c oxidase assembly protein [Spongiibacteraceae bacterium]